MQAKREVPHPSRNFEGVRALRPISARKTSQRLGWPYFLADIAVAVASVFLAFLITTANSMPADAAGFLALRISIKNLLVTAIFAWAWIGFFRAFGLYQRRADRYRVLRIMVATACGSSCALLFVITSRAGTFKVDAVLLTWIVASSLSLATRFLLRTLTEPASNRKYPLQVLIVGSGARAARVAADFYALGSPSYQVLGFVDGPGAPFIAPEVKRRLLGNLYQLEKIIIDHGVDEVLITLPVKSCYAEVQRAIEVCERTGVECKYLSDIFRPAFAEPIAEEISGFSVTSLKPTREDSRLLVKRAIDVIAALLGLVILSPVFLIIAFAIKLSGSGPVIFGQDRHGRNRRRFRMYKFRTMVDNAEQLQPLLEHRNEVAGPVFKISSDPRITRIGALLRRTSLDELPQLFNVLKGEMSLVGPRPLPVRDVAKFAEGRMLRRFCVVPGLTGLWQVNGRSTISFEDWIKHDFEYIDNWSLKLDFQILAKTVPAVWKGVGAV